MATIRRGRAAVVQVQLLGGVGAVTDRGQPLDVGPAKCRALLAALGLSVGEAVSVSRLVDLVWDDDAGAEHVRSEHFGTAQQTLPPHLAETPRIVNATVDQDDWSRLGEMAVDEG